MAASVPDAKAQQSLLSQCPSLPQQLGPSDAGTRWVGPGQSRCPPGTRGPGLPGRVSLAPGIPVCGHTPPASASGVPRPSRASLLGHSHCCRATLIQPALTVT